MPKSDEELYALLKAQLSPAELDHGVVYTLATPLAKGITLEFPQRTLRAPWDALLAFVDREPLANWGHSSRYILMDRDTGAVESVEARLPPFRREDPLSWRVFYQAPGVPDTALALPKLPT
jgi:hypothetical protein